MDGTEFLDACLVDALQGTDPKLEVWVYRVLNSDKAMAFFKSRASDSSIKGEIT